MTRLRATAPVAALILLAAILAWFAMRPPSVVPIDAAPSTFSAARAMATVRTVATVPHPSGSPEAQAIRSALAEHLRRIGLDVASLRGVGAGLSSGASPTAQAGVVETLVATLPGRDRTLPAVAIMAHTDSVPGSFGAADDGFGVATALETARAIAAGSRPARDLLLILTDGEEAGLLGARLFFADPRRAGRIGALVNVDSRGTSGLGTMFETGPGSGGLIARYRSTSTHRFAHSAATFLYHRLPNRTDLTAMTGIDAPALNFAFLAGEFDYHTPRDAVASVDPRTLQSLGDQVLPVVRSLAADPRPIPRGDDGVFADAGPVASVRYPAWIGWPLLVIALMLAGIGARGARMAGSARVAAATLASGLVAALAARLGYALTGVADDWATHHRIMAVFDWYEAALAVIAVTCLLGTAALLRRGGGRRVLPLACLVAGLAAVLLGRPPLATAAIAGLAVVACWVAVGRPVTPRDIAAGTLSIGLLLSLATQALAPALTPLLLWPVLAAAGGAAAMRPGPRGRWIAALLGVVPLAYLIVFGHAMLLALGVPTPEAIGLFTLLAAPIVLPLAGQARLGLAAGGLIMAAALMLWVRVTPPTARHPDLSQIYGVVDVRGRGWLVSPLERPDGWTRRVLNSSTVAPERTAMPLVSNDPVWRVPAPRLRATPPTIVHAQQGEWTRITVTPGSGRSTLTLLLTTDQAIPALLVGDRPLHSSAGEEGRLKVRWTSPGQPVTLRARFRPGTHLTLDVAETTETRLPLPARPPKVVPWLGSDRVIASARATWRADPE